MFRSILNSRMLPSRIFSILVIMSLLITQTPRSIPVNAQSIVDPTMTVDPATTALPPGTPEPVHLSTPTASVTPGQTVAPVATTPSGDQTQYQSLHPPLELVGYLPLTSPVIGDIPSFFASDFLLVNEEAGLCAYLLEESQRAWCFTDLPVVAILGVEGPQLFLIGKQPEVGTLFLLIIELPTGQFLNSLSLELPLSGALSCSSLLAGRAYCSIDSSLIALDVLNPTVAWSTRLDGTGRSVVSSAEFVFVSHVANVTAFDALTGSTIWRISLLDEPRTKMILTGPSLVLGTTSGQFLGLDPADGSVLWSRALPESQPCSAILSADALVIATENGILQRIDPLDAEVFWTYNPGLVEVVNCPGLAVVNEYLYSAAADGTLQALDLRTGTVVWSYTTTGNAFIDLTLAQDSLIIPISATELAIFAGVTSPGIVPTETPTPSPLTPEPTIDTATPSLTNTPTAVPTLDATPTPTDQLPEVEYTPTLELTSTIAPEPITPTPTAATLIPEAIPDTISAFLPEAVLAGSGGFTLHITGSEFSPEFTLLWDAIPLTTSYIDATSLQASVPADLVKVPGAFQLSILDTSTGEILTSDKTFAVIDFTPAAGEKLALQIVAFDWDDFPDAVQYRLQLALEDDFLNPLVDITLETSDYSYPKDLLDGQTYYWRLSSFDGVTWSDWSNTLHFYSRYPLPAPELLTPDNGLKTNHITAPPTLSWTEVPEAAYYQVHISTSYLFSTKIINHKTDPGVLAFDFPLLPDGKYYWRVRAFDSVGVKGAWSEYRFFKVDTLAPAVPAPQKPAKNAIVHKTTPRLTVSTVAGAKIYQFQVSEDPAFATTIVDGAATSVLSTASYKLTAAEALPFGTFYWRARAMDPAGNVSAWTPPRAMLVDIKKTPVNGSYSLTPRPVFTWGIAEGATNYRLQVATSADYDPAGIIIDETLGAVFSFKPRSNLPFGVYYWRMQVLLSGDQPGWTGSNKFVVTATIPLAPVLAGPPPGTLTKDNTPGLRWIETFTIIAPELRAKNRTIQVYLPPDYSTSGKSYPVVYFQDGNTKFNYKEGHDYHVDEALEQLYAAGHIEGVIAVGVFYSNNRYDEYSPWVNTRMLAWNVPNAAGTEGGEGDAYINFLVNTLKPEIDRRYRTLPDRENTAIAGGSMGGLISLYGGLKRQDVFSKVIAFSPAVWFAESGGAWLSSNRLINYIKSINIRDDMEFFLYVGTREWEGRPLYIYDSRGSLLNYPRVWKDGVQAVVNALLSRGHSSSRIKHVVNPGGIHEAVSWQLWVDDAFLWQFGGSVLPVNDPSPATEPDGTRIQGYDVQISRKSNFSELAHFGQVEQSGMYEPPPLLEDGRYYWRARAFNDLGVRSNWSLIHYIVLDTTPPPVPPPYKPSYGATVSNNPPALRVNAVRGAQKYQFQVATDEGFSNLLQNKSVTTLLPLVTFKPGKTLPWGQLYWRARSVDAVGNASAWTSSQALVLNILKTPAAGSVTTDTTPYFTWGSYKGALRYRLQISDDAAFPVDRIIVEVKRAATVRSYSSGTSLGDGVYFWRMQVLTASGWGDWTPPYSFNVSTKPTPPDLLSPLSGSRTTSTPVLSWSIATPGYWQITHFDVQVSDTPFFSSLIHSVNVTDPFFILNSFEPGTYYWRVKAVNELGVRSKWSAVWSFTVSVES